MSLGAFTIGHSTHSFADLAGLLERHDINAIADVRSTPSSRRRPEYNRDAFGAALGTLGIAYVFLGRELGGRPDDATMYEDGRVRYEKLGQSARFIAGLTRLEDGARRYQLAILCSEGDPIFCHRGLLISPRLESLGIEVRHILPTGELEPHAAAVTRLLGLFHLPPQDVFGGRADLLELASARQERRIAFRRDITAHEP
jgi:uncharacterized protein (DUF488 family)